MKRVFITPMLMLIASLLFTAHGADTFIAGFEDGEDNYELNTGWAEGYDWIVEANPETGGINSTDKCLVTTITNPTPDRWGLWVVIKLKEPILITEANRYVKIMAKRSPNDTNLALCFNSKENDYFGLSKPAKTNEWGDVVFDLFSENQDINLENKEVTNLMICLGTAGDAGPGVTMLDNMVLSDSPKPRGAQEIQPGLLVNFDDEALTAKNFASFEVQSQTASCETVANPMSDVANPSTKCLSYNKPASATWWHSLRTMVNGVVSVAYPNSNLHVMMYIPDASPVVIMAKSVTGKEVTTTFYPSDGEGWYDCVLDVAELNYIKEVNFRFNCTQEEDWANPAGTYYVDDFELSDNTEPRETIATSIKTSVLDGLNVYTEGNSVCVASPEFVAASVYSANGQLVAQTEGTDFSIVLTKGIYVVKVIGAEGKVSVRKIVIG